MDKSDMARYVLMGGHPQMLVQAHQTDQSVRASFPQALRLMIAMLMAFAHLDQMLGLPALVKALLQARGKAPHAKISSSMILVAPRRSLLYRTLVPTLHLLIWRRSVVFGEK
jgi:hypothetical protein